MIVNLAELAIWNHRNLRSRNEYELNPLTSHAGVSGPCLGHCGAVSKYSHGYCIRCVRAGATEQCRHKTKPTECVACLTEAMRP